MTNAIDNALPRLFGPVDPPSLGIHVGVPASTYREWAAANASLLKECRRSLAHGKEYLDRPERRPTDAMRLGTALHTWCLERERYDETIRIVPGFTGKKKADIAILDELTPLGITPIDDEDDANVKAMSRAISAHPYAHRLATSKGQVETVIVWRDEESGLLCKARCDKWWKVDGQSIDLAMDLKSTADASDESFPRDVAKYGYHLQAAFYRRALRSVTGRDARFLFVVVESSPPHGVRVVELDDASLIEGDRLCAYLLKQVARAAESNEWPAYSRQVETIGIPAWAMKTGDFRE